MLKLMRNLKIYTQQTVAALFQNLLNNQKE